MVVFVLSLGLGLGLSLRPGICIDRGSGLGIGPLVSSSWYLFGLGSGLGIGAVVLVLVSKQLCKPFFFLFMSAPSLFLPPNIDRKNPSRTRAGKRYTNAPKTLFTSQIYINSKLSILVGFLVGRTVFKAVVSAAFW